MAKINKKTRTKANADTRLKDQQERKLENSIISWHVQVAFLFSELLRQRSIAVEIPGGLRDDLRSILNIHYFDTATAFSGFPVRDEVTEIDDFVDQAKRNIQLSLIALIGDNIDTHTKSIVNTTNRDMQRAINDAREILGQGITHTGFVRTAVNILRTFLRARVSTRSMTETQFAAEGTRSILDDNTRQELGSNLERWDDLTDEEREHTEELADLSPAVSADEIDEDMSLDSAALIAITLQQNLKQWLTMGDGKVRTSHKFVNGQIVQITQPFIVGSGAQLMYPGDSSFGAGAADVVNCRCYAAYL